MSDITKAIPANEISNGNIVIYPNTTISYNSDQSDIRWSSLSMDASWSSPFDDIKWCVANQDEYY